MPATAPPTTTPTTRSVPTIANYQEVNIRKVQNGYPKTSVAPFLSIGPINLLKCIIKHTIQYKAFQSCITVAQRKKL